MLKLNIGGIFSIEQGYYNRMVRGLRAYEAPTAVTVKDLQGNILRIEQPVAFRQTYNNRRSNKGAG